MFRNHYGNRERSPKLNPTVSLVFLFVFLSKIIAKYSANTESIREGMFEILLNRDWLRDQKDRDVMDSPGECHFLS